MSQGLRVRVQPVVGGIFVFYLNVKSETTRIGTKYLTYCDPTFDFGIYFFSAFVSFAFTISYAFLQLYLELLFFQIDSVCVTIS